MRDFSDGIATDHSPRQTGKQKNALPKQRLRQPLANSRIWIDTRADFLISTFRMFMRNFIRNF